MFTFQGLPSGPTVRNSGLWKPDDRKGECGRSISPRANINEAVKSIDDYISIYFRLGYGNKILLILYLQA